MCQMHKKVSWVSWVDAQKRSHTEVEKEKDLNRWKLKDRKSIMKEEYIVEMISGRAKEMKF